MNELLIVGNWKMNGTRQDGALQRAETIASYVEKQSPSGVKVVICPPATLLRPIAGLLPEGSAVHLGGQDCHYEKSGAYTGDISSAMLKDAGCDYVIVGHSERRLGYTEDSSIVRRKAKAAMDTGLTAIICVGETAEQREQGQAEAVIKEQLFASLPITENRNFVVAYEPVWAIGSGKVPAIEDISGMHQHIISLIPKNLQVLYGGSVKPGNAEEILQLDCVGGVLVGGASLQAEVFCEIIDAAGAAA